MFLKYKNYDIKQHIFYCCLIVIGLNTLYVRYKSPTNEEIERCLSKIDNKDTRPAMVDLNKLSTDMCLRYTPSSR